MQNEAGATWKVGESSGETLLTCEMQQTQFLFLATHCPQTGLSDPSEAVCTCSEAQPFTLIVVTKRKGKLAAMQVQATMGPGLFLTCVFLSNYLYYFFLCVD